ncbi:MAG: hypothetical protein QME59_05355 [Candidatus Hydrothermarchaeota archaeon]|nr:hypothetical protein [Candidatus Hydrothermarchaeota archaeon]
MIFSEIKFWIELFFLLDGTILMVVGAIKDPVAYTLIALGAALMIGVVILETRVLR